MLFSLLTWFCLISSGFSQTRYRIAGQAVGGLYVFNSENRLPITSDGKFIAGYGANLSISRSFVGPYDMALDIQYFRSNADGPLAFNYSLAGAQTVSAYDGRLMLDQFSADVGLTRRVTASLMAGIGPSLAIVSRSVKVPYKELDDRLNSYCAGMSAVAGMTEPLGRSGQSRLYGYYTIKVRYLHSIFFDARGRALGNYSQDFLTASISIGVGYTF